MLLRKRTIEKHNRYGYLHLNRVIAIVYDIHVLTLALALI